MKFGYTIVYVPEVESSLRFFEDVFGFTRRFLTDEGDYGELETGETTLAFAALSLGQLHMPAGFVVGQHSPLPLGMELALVTDQVAAIHQQALHAGASEIKAPATMPWGQVVSYLRCPDGTLVELCTPMNG